MRAQSTALVVVGVERVTRPALERLRNQSGRKRPRVYGVERGATSTACAPVARGNTACMCA